MHNVLFRMVIPIVAACLDSRCLRAEDLALMLMNAKEIHVEKEQFAKTRLDPSPVLALPVQVVIHSRNAQVMLCLNAQVMQTVNKVRIASVVGVFAREATRGIPILAFAAISMNACYKVKSVESMPFARISLAAMTVSAQMASLETHLSAARFARVRSVAAPPLNSSSMVNVNSLAVLDLLTAKLQHSASR